MRQGWQRQRPLTVLTREQIGELVRSALPGARLGDAELVGGGLSNTNYKLVLKGPSRILRLRIFERGLPPAELERALAERLAGALPIPRFLHFAADSAFGRPYALVEWLPGEPLERCLHTLPSGRVGELGRDVGRVLSLVHQHGFAQAGLIGSDLKVYEPFTLGASWLVETAHSALGGVAAERLGAEFGARFLVWLEEQARGPSGHDEAPCLVHCDFGGSNILVSQGESPRVTGVLDWEYACAATPFIDFGNLLRPPVGSVAGFEAAVVAGYRETGSALPEDWKRRALLADLGAWLDFLGRPNPGDAVIASARERIEYTMAVLP